MPSELLSQSNASTPYEPTSHSPTQSLLSSLRSPGSSLDDLEAHLLRVLTALDAVPPPFSKLPTSVSRRDVLPILPTIHHVVLSTVLPTWLAPLRDADHLQLVQQLFCPSHPASARASTTPLEGESRCAIVTSALPIILSHLQGLTSKDPGPTAILDFCLSLIEQITSMYPPDAIHYSLFSPRLDTDVAKDRRSRDWEDYVRAACSVPGKVANALHERTDVVLRDSLEHGPYFSTICVSTERLIFHTSQNASRGTSPASQSHLLLKLLALGLFPPSPPALPSQPSFFAATLPVIRQRAVTEARYWEMWAAASRSFPATAQQTFFASLLGALECNVGLDTSRIARERVREGARILRGILGILEESETAGDEQLGSAVPAVICGTGWTWDIGAGRAVVRWIADPQLRENKVNEKALEKLLNAILSTWTDPEYIRHSLLTQHRYTSTLLLLVLSALPPSSPVPERLALSRPFVQCITTYLSHLDEAVRRCGMLVAEVVAARCGRKLQFDGWDDANEALDWARAVRAWQNDWTAAADDDDEPAPSAPASPSAADADAPPPPATAAYDSDDSLTGYDSPSPSSSRAPSPTPSELAEMEQDPTLRAGHTAPPARPVYLVQLVGLMRTEKSDDEGAAERLTVALAHAEALVRRKKGFGFELEENAVQLVISLVMLNDNYELPGFNEQRLGALVALVACCPQKSALTVVEQFFTNQYSIEQRMVMLTALALGARELSGLPGEPAPPAAFPSKMLPPALHQRYAQGAEQVQRLVKDISARALTDEGSAPAPPPVVRERQLRVGRLGATRVTPLSSAPPPPRAQTFADVAAEHFVMPLVNHMWRHLRDAQSEGAGAGVVLGGAVLTQYLGTLAVLLHAARNAPAFLAVLAPAVLELALTLGTQHGAEAAVLAGALETTLVVLDGCVALDGGRTVGLDNAALVLAAEEWVGGVLGVLERGRRLSGGGGAAEARVGRAAAGVAVMVERVKGRWGRSMVAM